MDVGLIALILNIVFALFLVLGFVKGLVVIKKKSLRLATFVVGVLIAGAITPFVSKAIMQIKITHNGVPTSLNDIVLSAITEAAGINDLTSTAPSISELLQNLPVMIGNLAVFIVLCYVMSFVTWIIYKILASVFIKKDKKEIVNGKKVKVKTKKYRLLGGLLGVVQGFILMFVTFVPISGACSLISDLSQSTVVSASVEAEQTPTAKLINENLPKEVKDIIEAYNATAIGKTTSVFGLDDFCFNSITSISVNGYTISLRDEVVNLTNIYDNVSYVFDLDFSSIKSLKDIDFVKLEKAINYAFDSNIVKSVINDVANIGFDELLKLEDVKNNKDYKDCVTLIKDEFNSNGQVATNLKEELLTIVGIAKTTVESGLIDVIEPENGEAVNADDVLDLLSKENNKLFNSYIDQIFNSKLISSAMSVVVNIGVDSIETTFEESLNKELSLGRIDVSNKELSIKKQDIKSLGGHLLNAYDVIKNIDFDAVEQDQRVLFNHDLPTLVTSLGQMADTIKNMQVMSQTGIYNNLLDALAETDYAEYVDFDVFKQQNIWTEETTNLANVFKAIKDSKIMSYIEYKDGTYSIPEGKIENVISCLSEVDSSDNLNKTYIRKMFEPLLDSKAFNKTLRFGLNEVGKLINDMGEYIIEDTKLGTLYLEKLDEEGEKDKLLAFFDNIVTYSKELDFNKLEEDPFITILESDLSMLGSALDSLKTSSMFKDYEKDGSVVKGIYTNLIEALMETEYVQYIGFESFLAEDFSWNAELNSTQQMIDSLLEKQIVLEDQSTISLIQYIIEGGDWEVIFKQIESEDLTNIFNPLLKSKIFKPTAVLALNKINEQIKNVIGDFGVNIPTIEEIGEEEVEVLIEVIDAIGGIVEDFQKEDFSISDLATSTTEEDREKIVNLLESMQDNANGEGVFKETYDALVDYITNDEVIGEQVQGYIEEYEPGNINWAELIAKLS